MDWTSFFEMHKDLPREGPGAPGDVAWAGALAQVPPGAAICDAGCGPGDDISALLGLASVARVDAFETHAPFADQARTRFAGDARVSVQCASMAELTGPYDLIWCAGALYFLGVTEGLTAWRSALAPGGAVAFSEPCWFTDAPSAAARAHWSDEYPPMTDEAGITAWVQAAGYRVLGTRRLSDAAWEAYYTPLEARIAMLRPGADAALSAMLDKGQAEVNGWRATRAEAGYLLCVVAPA